MNMQKRLCCVGMSLAMFLVAGAGAMAEAADVAPAAPKTTAAKAPATGSKASVDRVDAERMLRVMDGDSAAPLVAKVETAAAKANRERHARDAKVIREAVKQLDRDYIRDAREQMKARREREKKGKTRVEVEEVDRAVSK